MSDRIAADQLTAWVRRAIPGTALRYHRGFLAAERERAGGWGHDDVTRHAINRTCNRAWELHEEGAVRLVQRRHGTADYSYYAVKRRETAW